MPVDYYSYVPLTSWAIPVVVVVVVVVVVAAAAVAVRVTAAVHPSLSQP